MAHKRSLFERLTGSIRMSDDVLEEENYEATYEENYDQIEEIPMHQTNSLDQAYEDEDGELAIDLYQDGNNLVIKAMTAGVQKHDLDISITREMVTIKGRREPDTRIREDQYFTQELYWGSFSRSMMLPEEVEVEEAEAHEQHGLLTIILPLINKNKEAKLKVK